MQDGTLHIAGSAKTISLYASLAVLMLLCVLSVRTFQGAYYYSKVPAILDERSSEESITVMDLSAETVPAYQEAIKTLERAVFFDPSRALYRKALSDLYARLGSWTETMELLALQLPEGTSLSNDAFELSASNIRAAIRLQPTNPDNHLAYGHLSREMNNLDSARSEYQKAVNSYPGSSALRYSVIMEYLAAGMNTDALAQARELARIDDSYKMPESDHKQLARKQHMSFYMRQLYGSYLFKSFEIIWRTSGRDISMVRSSVPDNAEARDVFEMFVEAKGVIDR